MSDKRYTITITEQTFEKQIKGKDWEKISTDGKCESTYGYTPEIEKTVAISRRVFEQNTDELHLVNVIKAINNIQNHQ